jgi:hypothetical protein
MSGTESNNSNCDLKQPAKAGGKRLCHSSVPQLPRQYREHKKVTPTHDIAGNITIRIVFWVFATDSKRAGEKRGKQPLWLSNVMGYHIQPIARKLGIQKRIG